MPNLYLTAIAAELTRLGIPHEFQRGGKHPRVVYEHNGVQRFYVFPGSGSDGAHGVRNCIADIRKHLGVSAPVRGKSTRVRKSTARRPELIAVPDSFAVRANPLLALRAWKPPSRFTWIKTAGPTWRVEVRYG